MSEEKKLDSEKFFKWLCVNNNQAELLEEIYTGLKAEYKNSIEEKYYTFEQEKLMILCKSNIPNSKQERELRKLHAKKTAELLEVSNNLAAFRNSNRMLLKGLQKVNGKIVNEGTEYLRKFIENNLKFVE